VGATREGVDGDPFDFLDEGGWPYPDEGTLVDEPVDLRFDADEDALALHALTPASLARLSPAEQAAIVARFGLDGREPMTMGQLQASLGLSRDRARGALSGGLAKLRTVLG
jgi:Sigma-70, region 4